MQHHKAPGPTAEQILLAWVCRELTVEDDVAIIHPVELWECDPVIRPCRMNDGVMP